MRKKLNGSDLEIQNGVYFSREGLYNIESELKTRDRHRCQKFGHIRPHSQLKNQRTNHKNTDFLVKNELKRRKQRYTRPEV